MGTVQNLKNVPRAVALFKDLRRLLKGHKPCRFLSIPLDVRDIIYHFIFRDAVLEQYVRTAPLHKGYHFHPEILRTCKQVYHEAQLQYHRYLALEINGVLVEDPNHYLYNPEELPFLDHLRNLRVDYDRLREVELHGTFPNLRHLTIIFNGLHIESPTWHDLVYGDRYDQTLDLITLGKTRAREDVVAKEYPWDFMKDLNQERHRLTVSCELIRGFPGFGVWREFPAEVRTNSFWSFDFWSTKDRKRTNTYLTCTDPLHDMGAISRMAQNGDDS